MYVDQLRKRSEILGVQKSTLAESSTLRDAVLSGKVAVAVFKSAVKALTEKKKSSSSVVAAAFVTSLLGIADEFPFADEVRKEIMR